MQMTYIRKAYIGSEIRIHNQAAKHKFTWPRHCEILSLCNAMQMQELPVNKRFPALKPNETVSEYQFTRTE